MADIYREDMFDSSMYLSFQFEHFIQDLSDLSEYRDLHAIAMVLGFIQNASKIVFADSTAKKVTSI